MSLNFTRIGANIKAIRIYRNITQAELAEKIETSPSYISRIETGKKQASLETIVKIAANLGCTIDDLITGSAHIPQQSQNYNVMPNTSALGLQEHLIYETQELIKKHFQLYQSQFEKKK